MKQNTSQNNYVTKQDLIDVLKEFRKDVQQDIKDGIETWGKALEIRLDIKLEAMERRIDDRAREYNSEILTRFDTWAADLEKARIDRELNSATMSKHEKSLNNHEKRIKKLESIKN